MYQHFSFIPIYLNIPTPVVGGKKTTKNCGSKVNRNVPSLSVLRGLKHNEINSSCNSSAKHFLKTKCDKEERELWKAPGMLKFKANEYKFVRTHSLWKESENISDFRRLNELKRMKTTGKHLHQDKVTKKHKHSELRDMSQGFRSAGPGDLRKYQGHPAGPNCFQNLWYCVPPPSWELLAFVSLCHNFRRK